MDKLQWFKFAPSDWMMGKIMRCDEITQARYMRLVCLYWNKECNLSYEDAEIEIDEKHLDILIKKKIVKLIDDFIFIDFLNEQMEGISETSEKRRAAVKKRWDKVKQDKAKALQNDTSVLQNYTEESRVEETREDKSESKEKFTPEQFLTWFNDSRTKLLEKPSNSNYLSAHDKTHLEILTNRYEGKDFGKALHNLCNDKWANESISS
ncbi:MAG TPA: hypothetical protein EYO58_01890, partial [Flavobacteriales bacterium]|nr:hypothetical protein [Flavobacteriales bacterium]